jgi:hypothetical protein
VEDILAKMTATESPMSADTVDLLEEMLFHRASSGIRPMLYISSLTDLECSMLTLLEESDEVRWSTEKEPVPKQVGYHIVTN